jgi:hypothetical protein
MLTSLVVQMVFFYFYVLCHVVSIYVYCHVQGVCVTYMTGFGLDDWIY